MITSRFVFYLACVLAVFIYGLVKLKSLHPAYKILLLLIATTFLSEIATRILAHTIKNSFPAYYVFSPIQFLLICMVLYQLVNKKGIWVIGLIGLLLDAGIIIEEPFFKKFPSHLVMTNSILINILSLFGIYSFLNVRSPHSLFKQSWFWFFAGNLIFFTTTFLFFSLINYVQKYQHVPEVAYSAIWMISIVLNICYFLTLYTNAKYKTPSMPRP
jgi:hypothetical protein